MLLLEMKKVQISDLNFHLMKQENEEVIKPKANTRKRIIKIRGKINEIRS